MSHSIYLASPYSHTDPDIQLQRYEDVAREAAILINEGAIVFCPIAHSHPIATIGDIDDGTWRTWSKQDLAILERCDEFMVLMLPGWDTSVGINAETDFAIANEIPVTYRHPRINVPV